MSYYRRYRRQNYYRNNKRYQNSDGGVGSLLFSFLLIFLSLSFLSGALRNFMLTVLKLGFFVCLFFVAYKIYKIIFKSKDSLVNLEIGQIADRKLAEINSEKHGCKCYMEGLTEGEREVADTLSYGLSYKDYFLFNNLIIPSENSRSTQIDHIVVSKFGIFVIESKNYKGWIFGSKDQQTWTQSLPGGRNKFQFQNPIHQNYAHIMALKTLIPLINDKVFGIVVFADKSEMKTGPIENVVELHQLINSIKKYNIEKFNDLELHQIIGKLVYACQTNDITADQHIANLHAYRLEN